MTEQQQPKGRLRPMRADDLDRVLAWRNHPEIRRYMYSQNEIGADEHRRWFELSSQDPRKHLLVYECAGIPLGYVNFTLLNTAGVADWGFYAAPDAPKGTGRRLGLTALAHAFEKLGLHKVNGQALAYNERSISFHGALGFLQEGILRDQYFDGERYHAVYCFGMLRGEWLQRKEGVTVCPSPPA
jgi:UDP-4-amino-4,6-dideoxy-N-acetyl-beta-L-altrosamine N-acetyltransferase